MIVSCGEALIDFLPATFGEDRGYVPRVGGSPFNVAVALARLETPTGFLGRVSTDFFGDMLVEALGANAVDLRYVARTADPTTLGFVSLGHDSEPQYAFFNVGAADRMMTAADLPAELDPEIEALHFGSFSLAVEPSGSALAALMRRERGKRILSLDPNVRPTMIGERAAYLKRLEGLLGLVDLVKVSRADLEWLYPGQPTGSVATHWLSLGPRLVVITQGGDGSIAFRANATVQIPSEPVRIVDTVGAGDSFMAGILSALHQRGALTPEGLDDIDEGELRQCLKFANRVAGLTCARAGANPPHRREVGL